MDNLAFDFFQEEGTDYRVGLSQVIDKPKSTVEQWREELKNILNGFAVVLGNLTTAENEISNYVSGQSKSYIYPQNAIPEIINNWIEKQCQSYNSVASNTSHLRIEASRLPAEVASFSFPNRRDMDEESRPKFKDGHSLSDAEAAELAEYALTVYDFEGLEKAIGNVSQQIEQ
ncbi:MAG: hypothetical protein KUG73_07100, partial [Pseudomonadales bacterium]|nr:hypothetical protein [Pseudomonadales bacterium]